MSAILQVRVRESEAISTVDSEMPLGVPVVGRDNPLQLLREAITRLNSSSGELPDQSQMVDLLAEVREALERANVIARAAAECEEFLRDAQFDKALQSLHAALLVYPGDPALTTRRKDVEERQRAFQSAATVRTALEEAQWLLNQNRLDLAARFLKEKAAGLPDQPALISRLEEIGRRSKHDCRSGSRTARCRLRWGGSRRSRNCNSGRWP
jgi:predicted Zn-dependent protease